MKCKECGGEVINSAAALWCRKCGKEYIVNMTETEGILLRNLEKEIRRVVAGDSLEAHIEGNVFRYVPLGLYKDLYELYDYRYAQKNKGAKLSVELFKEQLMWKEER